VKNHIKDLGERTPRAQQVGSQSSPMRKRGYSDIDDCNLKALKLNTKASLQKYCEKKIKVVNDKHTGKVKGKKTEIHQRSPTMTKKQQRKSNDLLDCSSSSSS
jgi:hypothetical protein